ncbi:dTMP kinase [Candidatus Phytoplasma meliae]|uniref:Thymidylate kinase n=1 Tax=Candidatus Phytoplasma meliae TaxID=1848402 RepID=A0ABS5CY35_9MOLU|nr:dTMP kinase [Candidatus Phytoplasma meliae]MBP5835893.1 dTMP kinase [Candidatus Phytoplasma meliae]
MKKQLISFEGLDGSGKTTLISKLKHHLESTNNLVKTIQGLGDSCVGNTIRDLFLHHPKVTSNTKYLLSLANMIQTQEELITPSLLQGYIILIDRWFDSTYTYQSKANCIDYDDKITTNIINHFLIKPDIIFYLDINPKTSLNRKSNQLNHKLDLIEQKPISYFENVRRYYLNKYQYCTNSKCKHLKCNHFLIDANNSQKIILQQIIQILTTKNQRKD